jgi:hypothetical protein
VLQKLNDLKTSGIFRFQLISPCRNLSGFSQQAASGRSAAWEAAAAAAQAERAHWGMGK